jgi:glycosyltransferase involved in cell wall biosynthesis
MESWRIHEGLIHGWGKLEGTGLFPSHLHLEISSANGEYSGKLPVIPGESVPAKEGRKGRFFSVYGRLPAPPPPGASYSLLLGWPQGESLRLAIPLPKSVTAGTRLVSFDLPWTHYFARGWKLIRYRQWRLLFDKLLNMARMIVNSGLAPTTLIAWASRGGKSLVLVIDHDLGGGANLYRKHLMADLSRQGVAPILLTAHNGLLAYQLVGQSGKRLRFAHTRKLDDIFAALAETNTHEIIFNNILSYPHPLEMIESLTRWLSQQQPKPRFTFLVHDYYCVCPSWLLLDQHRRYCGVPDKSSCAPCLAANRAPFLELSENASIQTWRTAWGALLAQADEIRCFSNASREIVLKAYPDLKGRITVIPHDIPVKLRPVNLVDPGWPVVGIIGHINHHKGSEVIQSLAQLVCVRHHPLRIVIVGTIDCEVPSEVVTVTGPYHQEELPDLLEANNVNIGFLPSICSETFSFVTEEMVRMRLPILAFDLGAPGERVANYAMGRVIPPDAPERILEAIEHLYNEHVRNP